MRGIGRVIGATATPSVRRLGTPAPDGLDTQVGSGNLALTPAQAQQVAMTRLVIADPHTLVLDEATTPVALAGGASSGASGPSSQLEPRLPAAGEPCQVPGSGV